MAFQAGCADHPAYDGKGKPRTNCAMCWALHFMRMILVAASGE